MSGGVSSTGRSISPASASSASTGHADASRSRPQTGGLGHSELQSRGARDYTVVTAVASYLPVRDVAALTLVDKSLKAAVSPVLQRVQSLIGLAGNVAASSQPVAEAERVLKQVGKLPLDHRIGPLRALAAQVPKLWTNQANQVAERITQAAAGLAPQEHDALQAAMRGPDNGLQRGFAQTGFF
jgi:hypothetical protein